MKKVFYTISILLLSISLYAETVLLSENQKVPNEKLIQNVESAIEAQKKLDTQNTTPPVYVIESPTIKETTSTIESQVNKRLDFISTAINLKQFGYDFFKRDIKTDYILPISESYRLGPGDTISFYLWGDPVEILGLNGFYSLEIGRDGKVFVPNLGAIYLWGMSVQEAKDTFRKLLSKKFKKFELELTLGKIRNFPVYVTGEVEKQGMVFANGTNSVVDVLVLAGGVKKTGTLRDIVLKRNENGKIVEHHIDLYSILINGNPIDINLKEGDSIFVKPIGDTIAIFGGVKRAGIYELKKGETSTELISFAGGLLPSANTERVRILNIKDNKQFIRYTNFGQLQSTTPTDGDIFHIENLNFIVENNIRVNGFVKYPGSYSSESFKRLSEIIKKVEFLPDTNLYYGQILRKDLSTGKDSIINFVPVDVMQGKTDFELKPYDLITFYNKLVFQPIEISGEIENPLIIPYYEDIKLLDIIRSVNFKHPIRDLKLEIYSDGFINKEEYSDNKTQTNLTDLINDRNFKKEIKIKTIYLYDLLNKADKTKNIQLSPGTSILVKKVEPMEKDKTIIILGEVKSPGVYKYKSGMTLYDIIKEAGGYTEDAYPKSLIFIRESAKRLQYEQLQLTLISMEESIAKNTEAFKSAGGGSDEEKMILQMTLEKQKKLLDIIRKKAEIGLGRIALDLPGDLESLKKSNNNIELQDGDYIYIPSKPNYVLVLGSVYNQISLPYAKNKTVRDYIEDVGGFAKDADDKDVYLIKANGKVISNRNYSKNWFIGNNFFEQQIEQGDTIVIPQDLKIPVLWRPLIKDVTQIIFQALSTAVLAKRL